MHIPNHSINPIEALSICNHQQLAHLDQLVSVGLLKSDILRDTDVDTLKKRVKQQLSEGLSSKGYPDFSGPMKAKLFMEQERLLEVALIPI